MNLYQHNQRMLYALCGVLITSSVAYAVVPKEEHQKTNRTESVYRFDIDKELQLANKKLEIAKIQKQIADNKLEKLHELTVMYKHTIGGPGSALLFSGFLALAALVQLGTNFTTGAQITGVAAALSAVGSAFMWIIKPDFYRDHQRAITAVNKEYNDQESK